MNRPRRLYFCPICMHRQKISSAKDVAYTGCHTCQRKTRFQLCPWDERRIDAQRFAVREPPARERDRGLRAVR